MYYRDVLLFNAIFCAFFSFFFYEKPSCVDEYTSSSFGTLLSSRSALVAFYTTLPWEVGQVGDKI